eukprot:4149531-Alexandrium_andersonii.AAC.1
MPKSGRGRPAKSAAPPGRDPGLRGSTPERSSSAARYAALLTAMGWHHPTRWDGARPQGPLPPAGGP